MWFVGVMRLCFFCVWIGCCYCVVRLLLVEVEVGLGRWVLEDFLVVL